VASLPVVKVLGAREGLSWPSQASYPQAPRAATKMDGCPQPGVV